MFKIRERIDRVLNRLGYFRPIMPEGSAVSQAEIIELFRVMGQSDVFKRLLRDLAAQDVRLYFQASSDADREKLRGAWSRTNYFISLIQKANGKRNRD